jgi:NADH pyrophosphatase NudC (nudix superfamily)
MERALGCDGCGTLAYPRLAPAVIVLVHRDREVLLAQGRSFGAPMYSTLAGFVEPGESLEQCVAREVREEVGVEVTDITYRASQAWPFPHSLMVGFTARWAGGDIDIDESEIVDAHWFPLDELPEHPAAVRDLPLAHRRSRRAGTRRERARLTDRTGPSWRCARLRPWSQVRAAGESTGDSTTG